MTSRKILILIFEATVAGLAFAFLLLIIFRPETLQHRTVVEMIEGKTPALPAGAAPASYAPAVEQAAPAVLNIYSTKRVAERPNPLTEDPFSRRFFGGELAPPRERQETSLGSGVIVSPQGYILTNNHVIEGADEIQVALRDNRHAAAKVVGTDPDTDIAVLKIDMNKLPVITIGQSEHLHVGDVVLAIGNPYGVGQTVTSGIVSGTGRTQLGISTYENYIQTDAAINPGNSGGALINVYGQLVGINTAIFSRTGGSQGIGFAIPADIAKTVMQQILEQGHVVRGWLGIATQEITPDLAESFGLKNTQGALISGVLPGSPGAKAGLEAGDIIVEIARQPVSDPQMVLNLVAKYKPGDEIHLKVMRNGKILQLRTQVSQRPPPRLAQ